LTSTTPGENPPFSERWISYRLAPLAAAPAGGGATASTPARPDTVNSDAVSNDRQRFRRAIEASQPGTRPGRGVPPGGRKSHCAGEGMPATT